VHISVFNTQKRFPIDTSGVAYVVATVLQGEKQKADEASVHFVGKKKICALHAQYFDDPSTTDCISFPIDPPDTCGYRVLGEVFVCPLTAFEYLKKHGKPQSELYEEITLYVVHGLLHLLGYDDIDLEDQKVMRKKEEFYMKKLKAKNLLLKEKL